MNHSSLLPFLICSLSLQQLEIWLPQAAAAAKLLQSFATLRPHRRQPTRLCCPWDSPGKNTGMGCHFLLQCMKVKSESEVTQSCLTLCDPIDGSPPGSAVPGILQARTLEWVAICFSNAWKWKVKVKSLSCAHLLLSPALADGFFTTASPGKPGT